MWGLSKIFLLIITSFIFNNKIKAQDTSTSRPSFVSLKPQYGFIIPHRERLKQISGFQPYGIEAEYGWYMNKKKDWKQYNCYSRSGFSIMHINYNSPDILGSSTNFIAYAEPFFNYKGFVLTSLRMGAGISYLSRVYHPQNNPENLFFSTPVSFLVHIDFNFIRFINENWFIKGYLKYNHISNGGIKKPNKGMNFPTYGIGVGYSLDKVNFKERKKQELEKPVPINFEIQSFATLYNTEEDVKVSKMVPSFGFLFKARRKVSSINALNIGLEGVANYYLKQKNKNSKKTSDYRQGAVLTGHEFVFGRFNFSQLLGFYLYAPYYKQNFFQRYSLTLSVYKEIKIGVTLKAHKEVAENFNFLLGYSF